MGEPTLYPESGFSRFKITLAYDGTNFSGWAKQADQRTVQGDIEDALQKLTGQPIEVIVAGRTDAGVHATAQVIHADIPDGTVDIDNVVYKINRILDEDVRVYSVEPAASGFNARFSALRRHYQYKIADNNRILAPLARYDVATWYRPLSDSLLNEASDVLLGEHDFAAFCKFREGGTTIRRLERFYWRRIEDGIVSADIVADAFCYQQVRNMVGAVVTVAEGRHDIAWLQSMLANKTRVTDSLVFPANGLTLTQVDYPADSELLDRAHQTIARRDEQEN